MINWKLFYKIVGSLLFVETTMMLWCLLVSLIYQQDDAPAFIISMIVTLFCGFVFRFMGLNAQNNMTRRDAYLVVTVVWILFCIFATLPFLISGYISSFTDAFFEMMSGFTTTGATILNDVEHIPHGLLFWRSMTHWIGGLGIVFFTIAVLPSMVGGSVKVFSAEATGPIKTKLHPRLSTCAKWIWIVYLVLTVSCAGSYYVAGMNFFDSVNYAMATTATGGFSTHNTSISFFNSPAIEYVATLFCFLSGMNFTLLYTSIIKLHFRDLLHNSELKFYASVVAMFTLFIMIELIISNGYNVEMAFRKSVFHVVSFITTTGFFNDNAALWPHVTWVVLAMCMFIGGCSGSTGGGFKCIRGIMILKVIKNQFRQMLHPNAVLPMKIDGHNLSQGQRVTLLSFFSLYVMLFVVNAFIFCAMGISNTDAVTITLSSMGNVGPALGSEIGPTMSWNILPPVAKWMCSFLMLAGRLEIFSVLVIFTPAFWKKS